MSELDFIFAKARFGCDYDCIKPDINESGVLSLKQARHPLIDQEIIVPNDIIIDGKMLMITGSNTGGKTVSLKTVGLLTLMQSIPILVMNNLLSNLFQHIHHI